jgi:hypothetical protein
MGLDVAGIGSIADLLSKGLDKIFVDAGERERAKLALFQAQQAGELNELDKRMAAIIAEASSADPWTSRARPSFMYVFYLLIITLVLIAPTVGVFWPDRMTSFFANTKLGFAAIPDAMWMTFSAGYLGYVAARQYGKGKGTDK